MAAIGPHDLGTLPAIPSSGTLPEKGDRQHAFWERQVHATAMLLVSKGHLKVDEVRRGIEYLDPKTYAEASYYEKWASSICSALLERQLLSNQELLLELGDEDATEPRFPVGAVVRVKPSSFATRWRRPHLRTPGFVHGRCGVVERYLGAFANPEQLAFGGKAWGNKSPLYLIRFDADSIQDFDSGDHHQVTVEIYQSWLEAADAQGLLDIALEPLRNQAWKLEQQKKRPRSAELPANGHDSHPDCKRSKTSNEDSHHHGDHVHEERVAVEQRAVDEELPCPNIARALVAAVQKKGLLKPEELRGFVEKLDANGPKDRGAVGRKVVARAWLDDAFKARLLADANQACAEIGINAVNPTAPTQLVVFEQTPKEHHLIVCTLCSCYPLPLLGLSPDWYKSREYRSRAVREPRKVLKEFGTTLPEDVQVVVHDSTADCRYMILPRRPKGTEGWSEEKLQEIVSRDSMIGVTLLPEAVSS